ncbi:putative ribonuclease H-like domain-containing protein, partial [Tanacetum coccineum]
GTEFKNHAMNELCAKKGIKREFSVARISQQNVVAERKNRTLIKTPYELLIGKFDGKSDEGYLLGYSTTSSLGKDKEPTQEYILLPLHPHRIRIPVEDVAPAAHENPSKISPKVNDVHDSEDVADKEGQHQMTKDEQVLPDDLEKMMA